MMNVEMISPDGAIYKGDVTFVSVPTAKGELGFEIDHSPLLAGLTAGKATIEPVEAAAIHYFIPEGFVSVDQNQIKILVPYAEPGSLIDIERAEKAKKRAEERLGEKAPDIDLMRAEKALRRARARIYTFMAHKEHSL